MKTGCTRKISQTSGIQNHLLKNLNFIFLSLGANSKKKPVCHDWPCRTNNTKSNEVPTQDGEGKKPYNCSLCDKSFSDKNKLKKHLRILKNKTHICPNCNQKFHIKSDLKKHFDTVHEGKPHKCSLCGKNFKFNSSLKRHFDVVHLNDYTQYERFSKKHTEIVHEGKNHMSVPFVTKVLRSKPSWKDILIQSMREKSHISVVSAIQLFLKKVIWKIILIHSMREKSHISVISAKKFLLTKMVWKNTLLSIW